MLAPGVGVGEDGGGGGGETLIQGREDSIQGMYLMSRVPSRLPGILTLTL